jgi:hypothetical protein
MLDYSLIQESNKFKKKQAADTLIQGVVRDQEVDPAQEDLI